MEIKSTLMIAAIAVAVNLASLAQATVSFGGTSQQYRLSDGLTPVPNGSKWTLVLDMDSDGHLGMGISPNPVTDNTAPKPTGSFNLDPDDMPLGMGATVQINATTPGRIILNVSGVPFVPAMQGKPLFLLWWNIPAAGVVEPDYETEFGIFQIGVCPGDGGTVTFNRTTMHNSPTIAPDGVMRYAIDIPEPASMFLAVVGGVLLLAGRRNPLSA